MVAAVQVLWNGGANKIAGGWMPVTDTWESEKSKAAGTQTECGSLPKESGASCYTVEATPSKVGGFKIGWAETAARGVCQGGEAWELPMQHRPESPRARSLEVPPRREGPCGRLQQSRSY